MSEVTLNAKDTHILLLRQARDSIEQLILDGMPADEALALGYLTFLVAECVELLHDTDDGARAVEQALQRSVPHGLVAFALRHGTIIADAGSTLQ